KRFGSYERDFDGHVYQEKLHHLCLAQIPFAGPLDRRDLRRPLSAFGVCGDEDGCEVLVDSKNVI
ncbi:hypothetical protein, partial [Rhizobium leguminosarum]|uniref:hypothetical protein n=1 Tax=Rhizobium leguminosarum TaxID=384 RepID=UPI00197E5306